MTTARLHILMEAYLQETLSEAARQELVAALDDPIMQGTALQLIEDYFYEKKFNYETDLEDVTHRILAAVREERVVAPVRRMRWFKYAAAAAMIIVITGLSTWLVWKPSQQEIHIATTIPDVQPASKKAYLTLSNGQQIVLTDMQAGEITERASKTADGKLVYADDSEQTLTYHTVTIPRGGEPQYIQLPDKSNVWLNTASSITYPTAFTGAVREVRMTGEVYFEVAKNGKPFIVYTRTDRIEVLGTHFNIHAYEEEGAVKTTLLEGKVKVAGHILAPEEQYAEGRISKADVTKVMAWRNGLFSYDNADVQTLMRDIARWYDLEVVFEGTPTDRRFQGEIGRTLTLKQLLNGLSFKDVNYRLEKGTNGRNRIVMLP